MKNKIIYFTVIVSLLFIGCSEEFLNPERDTRVLTSAQIENNSEINPALVTGTLDGIYSFMIEPGAITQTSTTTASHYDLGQKGVDIWTDILSSDMALSANSYNWYSTTANLITTVNYNNTENYIIWAYYYNIINSACNVINQIGGNDANPSNPEIRYTLGQAKALRAHAYFYLTQLFQRKYDPTQPILPFNDGVTLTPSKVPASQIYSFMISDLNSAINLLDGFNRDLKHRINKDVAKGILVYVHSAMGNYADAKTVANEVIASGNYPLTSTAQLAFPGLGSGFNNVATPSWMWGYDITADMGHQLLNWWGQIDYFTYSYAWAGDRKSIDTGLLAMIPSNDVRKTQFGTSGTTNRMPINKFFAPNRTAGGQQNITTDYIFMRIEEMYLLSAEAAAKTGDEPGARATLKALLASRLGSAANAASVVDPLTGQGLKDYIYLQTRIELWGEGKSYLAMKRNQATVTRGTNHVFRAGQSFAADSDELSFQIPRREMDNNAFITGQN